MSWTALTGYTGTMRAGNRSDTESPPIEVDKLLRDLPTGQRWIDHLTEDLLPFWTMPEALGEPLGKFPTYRHNNGKLADPSKHDGDFAHPIDGIVFPGREHVRAQSRQIYAYCVAYHLTGNDLYLKYARAGADYLRTRAFDRINGGAASYLETGSGVWGPPPPQRTSQDLAYALTGIGFLYYLTRDKGLEEDLVAIHDHIFSHYYNSGAQLIRWVLEPSPDNDQINQKELVAHLDQIYGYMLLVTPALPAKLRAKWQEDLVRLSQIIMQQFYATSTEMFWGAITSAAVKKLGTPHTDFGHSVKTFWLISLIGELTNNYEMFTMAQRHSACILDLAFLERSGSWARALDASGRIDDDKEWWICCELDQVAGALSLNDPSYLRYVVKTYDYWFKYMVDHEYKEVWHMVSGATNRPVPGFPKQHSWKNALHSFEHALVGYIVAQELHGSPTELYFSLAPDRLPSADQLYPYFYLGSVAEVAPLDPGPAGWPRQKVSFVGVH